MKLGQIEMMGLVIIVFLIVVIGLFALKLGSREDSGRDLDIYYSVKIDNLVNAIYRADLGPVSFETLAVSCCDGNSIDCLKVNDFVNATLNSMIDESVGVELKFSSGASCLPVVGDCSEGVGSSSVFIPGGYEIRAILCRK